MWNFHNIYPYPFAPRDMNKLTRARVGNLSSGIYRMEVTVFKYKHPIPLRAIIIIKEKTAYQLLEGG